MVHINEKLALQCAYLSNGVVILQASRFGFSFKEGVIDDDAVVAVICLILITPRLLALGELVGKPI